MIVATFILMFSICETLYCGYFVVRRSQSQLRDDIAAGRRVPSALPTSPSPEFYADKIFGRLKLQLPLTIRLCRVDRAAAPTYAFFEQMVG